MKLPIAALMSASCRLKRIVIPSGVRFADKATPVSQYAPRRVPHRTDGPGRARAVHDSKVEGEGLGNEVAGNTTGSGWLVSGRSIGYLIAGVLN